MPLEFYLGYSISYSTVYRYLRNTLNTKPYKRQRQPKLTEKQRENRLKFCKARQNWTTEEWKRVIFSDECPFELIHAPNRQNDRIWAPDKSNVPPIELVKHPPKIQVWGMISYQTVSDLHMIDPGQTVTADYYSGAQKFGIIQILITDNCIYSIISFTSSLQ